MTDADRPKASDGGPPLADEHFQPPRLSILHLLIWTAVAATLLKFIVVGAWRQGAGASGLSLLLQAIRSAYCILEAAGLTGLGVLVVSRLRGGSGRLQPGHWVLFTEVSANWCVLALYEAYEVTHRIIAISDVSPMNPDFFPLMKVYMGLSAAACLCCATLYSIAAGRTKDGRRWKAFFLFLAIAALLTGLVCGPWFLKLVLMCNLSDWDSFRLVEAPQRVADAVVLLGLLVSIAAGLRGRRDWLHWLGLGYLGGIAAMDITFYVWVALLGLPLIL
jgi:hypothetical protein